MADIAPQLSRSEGRSVDALQPIGFSDIPGWAEDDHSAAFRAFRAGAGLIVKTPPKTRSLGIDGAGLTSAARHALARPDELGGGDARLFFERYFCPHRIGARGFVTGYYEPEVTASRSRTSDFSVPLYRRPDDLVDVGEANRPPGWDPEIRFARRSETGILPFYDRREIEAGVLNGRGLELAWLRDPVDAFFIHVQGSARLRLLGGGTMRVAFDGKSGQPYTSIGRLAVERGILARDGAHKDGLEAWLKGHPEAGRALMRENRSFIFFRETELAEHEGPLGAAGVPLTAGRSLAIDRKLMTFHTPIWVAAADLPNPDAPTGPFRRLMIAQDTGSAIVGPARGDIFFGSGDRAGSLAGHVRHEAEMIALVPVPSASPG
jgi:membrane-bound lytic murein transglycosylase A